uniref:protein-glutamine gamma-glutamyltransferase n=1 Tax=Eptatretus burgeri TaxID=7764 RepID=A0A8C4Q815_EPTBU
MLIYLKVRALECYCWRCVCAPLSPVEVIQIDFQREANSIAHHTDEYECPDGVARRGQAFDLQLLLNRPFRKDKDSLSLRLTVGEKPQMNKGTEIHLRVSSSLSSRKWRASVKNVNACYLTLSVTSPPDCVVGLYTLDWVKSYLAEGETPSVKTQFYILFNPWCIDDTVYMEGEDEKKEYILNETGKLYIGSSNDISSRSWNFGQFEEGVLQICFELLDNSEMPVTARGNPVDLCRVLTAIINSQDDEGVLEGNWSGEYKGGTEPTHWLGSVEILKEYHEKQKPVRYGQCWVFSAVLTTVMRSLGIPCRSVTNFDSAHDSDKSITIDVIFDEDGKEVEKMESDSIWNFHVWNDCWMKRPDLIDGFDGWQAIDATPQETSSGVYQCGPSSLKAIKNGMVYLNYDTPFLFAEVNSDRIFWRLNKKGRLKPFWRNKNAVGHFISTQAVGGKGRADVTNLYKYLEGSEEERIAVDLACKHGALAQELSLEDLNDVTVTVKSKEEVFIGSKVPIFVTLKNSAHQTRQLIMVVRVNVIYYTGVKKGMCKEETFNLTLEANAEHKVELSLESSNYMDLYEEHCALQCVVTGRVLETREPIIDQHTFHLKEFSLPMLLEGRAKQQKESKIKLSFKNPLDKPLKDVMLKTEGVGLKTGKVINLG